MRRQIFWAPAWVVEEKAGALSLFSLTRQPFLAAPFPREMCLAMGKAQAAQPEERRYSLSALRSTQSVPD